MILVLTREDLLDGMKALSIDYIDISSFGLSSGLGCIMKADFAVFIDRDKTEKILRHRCGTLKQGKHLLENYLANEFGV